MLKSLRDISGKHDKEFKKIYESFSQVADQIGESLVPHRGIQAEAVSVQLAMVILRLVHCWRHAKKKDQAEVEQEEEQSMRGSREPEETRRGRAVEVERSEARVEEVEDEVEGGTRKQAVRKINDTVTAIQKHQDL